MLPDVGNAQAKMYVFAVWPAIAQNPQLLEGSFSPIIKIPKCRRFLHFDIKRAFFKSKMRKIKHTATRQFGTLRVAVRRSKVCSWF